MTSSTGDRKLVRTTAETKEERPAVVINGNLHNKNNKRLGIPSKKDEVGRR